MSTPCVDGESTPRVDTPRPVIVANAKIQSPFPIPKDTIESMNKNPPIPTSQCESCHQCFANFLRWVIYIITFGQCDLFKKEKPKELIVITPQETPKSSDYCANLLPLPDRQPDPPPPLPSPDPAPVFVPILVPSQPPTPPEPLLILPNQSPAKNPSRTLEVPVPKTPQSTSSETRSLNGEWQTININEFDK